MTDALLLSRRQCLLTALFSAVALPAASAETRQARLQAVLQRLVDDPTHPLCGVGVASVRHGRVDLMAAAGLARVADGDVQPMAFDTDSLVRIASLSKMVTTLGVMRLVEEGRLRLDQDVSELLGFPLRHPEFPQTPVTLRLLLSHQAGLDDGGGYFWPAATALRDCFAGEANATHWSKGYGPGQRFSYSNLGFGLTGTIMEAATGERFDKLMRRLVLDPLGVQGDYNPQALPAAQQAHLAGAYVLDKDLKHWLLQRDGAQQFGNDGLAQLQDYQPGRNATLFSPTGGLRASVNDLARIARTLLRQGPQLMPANRLAEREQIAWRSSPSRPQDDTFEGGGLAWGLGVQRFLDHSEIRTDGPAGRRAWGDRLTSQPGFTAWGHEGVAYGALTGLYYRPEHGDALIYVVNGSRDDVETYRAKHSSHHRYQEVLLDVLRNG